MEQEITMLTGSYGNLKSASFKFNTSLESLSSISSSQPLLIPLSSSLYVNAKIKNQDSVIVDIGTGYFVEKTLPDAKKYYTEKVDFLSKSIESLGDQIVMKQKQYTMLIEVIQDKLRSLNNKAVE